MNDRELAEALENRAYQTRYDLDAAAARLRVLADLLDAIGDPDRLLHIAQRFDMPSPRRTYLRAIADAVECARGEGA